MNFNTNHATNDSVAPKRTTKFALTAIAVICTPENSAAKLSKIKNDPAFKNILPQTFLNYDNVVTQLNNMDELAREIIAALNEEASKNGTKELIDGSAKNGFTNVVRQVINQPRNRITDAVNQVIAKQRSNAELAREIIAAINEKASENGTKELIDGSAKDRFTNAVRQVINMQPGNRITDAVNQVIAKQRSNAGEAGDELASHIIADLNNGALKVAREIAAEENEEAKPKSWLSASSLVKCTLGLCAGLCAGFFTFGVVMNNNGHTDLNSAKDALMTALPAMPTCEGVGITTEGCDKLAEWGNFLSTPVTGTIEAVGDVFGNSCADKFEATFTNSSREVADPLSTAAINGYTVAEFLYPYTDQTDKIRQMGDIMSTMSPSYVAEIGDYIKPEIGHYIKPAHFVKHSEMIPTTLFTAGLM